MLPNRTGPGIGHEPKNAKIIGLTLTKRILFTKFQCNIAFEPLLYDKRPLRG
jgi:hypothetical protein